MNKYLYLACLAAMLFIGGCTKEHIALKDPLEGKTDTAKTFNNPVKPSDLDPYVYEKGGYYYYMSTGPNYITLTRAQELIYLNTAYYQTVYTPEIGAAYSANVSKPEIYFLNGKWYIYFSADNGLSQNRKIFAIENTSADPFLGKWVMKGAVADSLNNIAATDGTILEYNNELYFLWSGVKKVAPDPNLLQQQIYIAKMSTPYTLSSSRVMISEPTSSWERYDYTVTLVRPSTGLTDSIVNRTEQIDQNPEVIKNAAGDVFVTFTANTCETDNVSIGLLTLRHGGDPLNPADWTKSASPVFVTNAANQVYGPAFNGFFKSDNNSKDWIIYNANSFPDQGCGSSRSPRIQQITWNTDGTPNFGTPVSLQQVLPKPTIN